MDANKPTTCRFTEAAVEVLQEHLPTFTNVATIANAGIMAFGKMTDSERLACIRESKAAPRKEPLLAAS